MRRARRGAPRSAFMMMFDAGALPLFVDMMFMRDMFMLPRAFMIMPRWRIIYWRGAMLRAFDARGGKR